MNDTHGNAGCSLTDVIELIRQEICKGAKHGFYNMGVEVEVVKGDRRQFTIRAGRSWRFVLRPDELEK